MKSHHPMPGCAVCGARLKRHARRFCSVRCRSVVYRGAGHQSAKPHAACAICGLLTKRPGARYCSVACRGRARRGSGGRYVLPTGYVMLSRDGVHIFEHRAVMAAHLGRPLLSTEHIHHRDGNRANNAIENLEILARGDHAQLHGTIAKVAGWSKAFACCIECGTTKDRHDARGRCHRCAQRLRNRHH